MMRGQRFASSRDLDEYCYLNKQQASMYDCAQRRYGCSHDDALTVAGINQRLGKLMFNRRIKPNMINVVRVTIAIKGLGAL